MPARRNRHWAWDISSFFYAHTYLQIAHQVDTDLIAFLGDKLRGAWVADCGCGPGVVTEKLLQRGADKVLAIDANPRMLMQVRHRLSQFLSEGSLELISSQFDGPFLAELTQKRGNQRPLDVVLFKRSLYAPPAQALETLKSAVDAVGPGGVVAVIHPERSLGRYAFGEGGRPTSFTAFHLFNRFISRVGELAGAGRYTLYRQSELARLMRTVAAGHMVEMVPTAQRPYNIIAIVKTNQSFG